MTIRTLIISLLLFPLLSACSPPRTDPAVIAYQQLIAQLSMGSKDGVWSLLTIESKQKLCRQLECKPSSNSAPLNFTLELDWAFESPFAGKATLSRNFEEKSINQKQKYIHTIYASQPWLIPVVLEKGTWRVHLLGARPLSSNHQTL